MHAQLLHAPSHNFEIMSFLAAIATSRREFLRKLSKATEIERGDVLSSPIADAIAPRPLN